MIAKQTYLKVHRWLGLFVGLFLFSQGLTGAVLAFRDQLEPVVEPAIIVPVRPDRAPVQTLLDAFHRAHPDAELQRAEFPDAVNQAVMFKWAKGKNHGITAVDPFDGRIVRDGTTAAWPLEVIFDIHEELLSGPSGETAVSVLGASLLIMLLCGLAYWWPGRGRFRKAFRVKLDGTTDVRWRTLHRTVGASVALILLMSATTGILMIWKDQVRAGLSRFVPAEARPAPKVAKLTGAQMLPVDLLIAKTRADYGSAPLRQLRFSSGGRVVAVYIDSNRTVRADGTSQIYYNRYDGHVLGRYVAGTQSGASEFLDWLYTVHTGLWGGRLTQGLMSLVGLTLAGMAASGLFLFWSRSRRKQANARRAKGRAPIRPVATPSWETHDMKANG